MRVSMTLLANMARVGTDGLLYIEGGGWEKYHAGAAAKTVQGVLAGTFEVNGEPSTDEPVHLDVVDQDGRDLGGHASFLPAGSGRLLPFAVPFTIVLPTNATEMAVRLSDADGVFSTTSCAVVPQTLPPPTLAEG